MEDGGILFSLLPLDCLFAAHAERVWRQSELLAKHTLLAVMTFPTELFSHISQINPVGCAVSRNPDTRYGRISEPNGYPKC